MFRRRRADGDRRLGHKPEPETIRVVPAPVAPKPAIGGDWALPVLPQAPYIAFPNSGQTYPAGASGGVVITPYTTSTTNWSATPTNLIATLTTNAGSSVSMVSGVVF